MKDNLRSYFDQELLDTRVAFGTMTDEQGLFLLCTQCFEVCDSIFYIHIYFCYCHQIGFQDTLFKEHCAQSYEQKIVTAKEFLISAKDTSTSITRPLDMLEAVGKMRYALSVVTEVFLNEVEGSGTDATKCLLETTRYCCT